ncbi:MAG: N-acetyltransferase [Dehalococcoidia bacterium]|nr:N-acetyltransferase [Dehalococcoidia bacterium]
MSQENQPIDMPIINIYGEKVALGPHRRDLLPFYQKWINDLELTVTLAIRMVPITLDEETFWYERSSQSRDTDIAFTIYERSSMRPIGNTRLFNISHQHQTAEYGIMIGEKDCWGKGYGTEVTALMLEYGYTALSLHNIMLKAYSFNERGLRAYTRAGFREIGRRREARRLAGASFDEVYMDCLASEFKGSALSHLLPQPNV